MNRLIAYFVNQATFVNIITIFTLVLGVFSTWQIRREVFPNINFDTILVQTAFPGGSAESTEKLITNPLEQDLKELDGIKQMTSTSVEGQSVIVLRLDPDQITADEAEADIQDVVDAFQDLPDDAEDPVVSVLESKNRPIITLSLSGKISEEDLRKNAKIIKRRLENIPEVAKINYKGLRDFEIKIEAQPQKLKKYRVSLPEIINALRQQNRNIPGGILEPANSSRHEMIIRTVGELKDAEDVKNTIVRANVIGQPIKIKDVAQVNLGFKKEKYSYRTNGHPSINLTLLKTEKADAIHLVDKLKEKMKGIRKEIDPKISIDYINDSSYFVRRRIKVLTNNLFVGLGLVLLILSLILPVKIAIITAFGIPFSFLAAISIFHLGEISLNLISMMGLIIVVGMLVDDAVVITENTQAKMEEGLSPKEAAVSGTQEIWPPVTTSVLTTVIAFAPLMFMSGIMGKFIKYIPIGVILSLLVSLWECFFILPHHVAAWVKDKKGKARKLGIFELLWKKGVLQTYGFLLKILLKTRYVVVVQVIIFGLFSVNFAKENMSFILFPPGAIDTFMINIEAPIGTSLKRTKELIRPIEEAVHKLPKTELLNFTSTLGLQGERNARNMKRGGEYAQIVVHLTSENDRKRKAFDIIEDLREKLKTPEGIKKISFARRQSGPPVGKPVSIGVRGEDYSEILPVVDLLKAELEKIPGVSDAASTYIEGKEEIQLSLKPMKAAAAGLSLESIGRGVRSAFEGIVPTSIKTLDEEVDIRVTLGSKHKTDPKTIDKIEIPNNRGQLIRLSRVANWQKHQGISVYEHENNRRQVSVTSEVDTKITNSKKVNSILREYVQGIKKDHPAISFHFGGEESDTNESVVSLIKTFGFAFFGIFLLLILLFKNIYQPLLVACTIPMGIIGVIWTFYFHKEPLTFLAMVGIIALSGVIVNNAIVFVDFFNKEIQKQKKVAEAIHIAAMRRIRPIFLTTITTVAGILPTAYGVGGLDPFVVPIALSLGWGMLWGSILTLLVFPAILMILEDLIHIVKYVPKLLKTQNQET